MTNSPDEINKSDLYHKLNEICNQFHFTMPEVIAYFDPYLVENAIQAFDALEVLLNWIDEKYPIQNIREGILDKDVCVAYDLANDNWADMDATRSRYIDKEEPS